MSTTPTAQPGRPSPPRPTPALAEYRRIKTLLWQTLMYSLLIGLSLIFLFPIIWAVVGSIRPLKDVYDFPSLVVTDPQWSNYSKAMSKLPFLQFILNTIVICVAAVTGQVLSASMVGYAFARLKWKGRDVWFIILLATMMLPLQVLLIPRYLEFKYLGWINTYKPLIVPEWLGGAAFFIFLFRQFFKGIPRGMEEAARIDGASEWRIFWSIFLPNAKPVLMTVGVLAFISHWKEFMRPLIYLTDFEKYPISVGLQMYNTLEGSWINQLLAASIVALSPLVLLFLLAQRFLVKGLLLSGDKG